jgi:hypothetical protein
MSAQNARTLDPTPDAQIASTPEAPRRRGGGPKTPEGKERSKRNALRHGLSGDGTVLPEDLEAEYRAERARLVAELRPANSAERRLVERAALAGVRLDRCRAMENAAVARRLREARRRFDERGAEELARWAGRLEAEPFLAKVRLEGTGPGCLWLIERWAELGAKLGRGSGWDADDARLALRLLGESRPPTLGSRRPVAQLGLAYLALRAERAGRREGVEGRPPAPDDDPFRGFFGPDDAALDDRGRLDAWRAELPSPDDARAALAALVEAEVARLEALRDALRPDEDHAREEAPLRALVDDSPEGARLHRYENASWSALRQSLADLARRHRDRAADDGGGGETRDNEDAPAGYVNTPDREDSDGPEAEPDDAGPNELAPGDRPRRNELDDPAAHRSRRERRRAKRLEGRKRRRR